MSNEVVEIQRQHFPQDARSDQEITSDYFNSPDGPALAQQYPAFGEQARMIAAKPPFIYKPPLAEDLGHGVESGTEGLLATGEGALGLAFGFIHARGPRDYFLEKAQSNENAASQVQPSIESASDVGGISDAAHYVAGKTGQLIPNIAEAAISAGIGATVGAAAGTAAEPGGGTVLGAGGGLLAGLLEKQAIKSLIRRGVISGLEDLAGAEGSALVKTEAVGLAKKYGAELANSINFTAQSAGSTYNTLSKNPDVDPQTAINVSLLGGLAQGLPAQFLPSYITGKFFGPEASHTVGGYFVRLASEAGKVVPGGVAAMDLQELASIASEKYADPKTRGQAFDISQWSKADKSRLVESSVTGGLAGLIGAPLAAIPGGKPAEPADATKNYTGDQSTARTAQIQELAQRSDAGQLTPADEDAIKNFTPEQRNQFIIATKPEPVNPAPASPEPSAAPTVQDQSDLAAVTARIKENQSPLVQHPELSDDEVLKALQPKPPEPAPPAGQTDAGNPPAAAPTVSPTPAASDMGNPISPSPTLAAARAASAAALDPDAMETRAKVAQAAAKVEEKPPTPSTPTSQKPKVTIDGIPIAMENAAGGTRTGKQGDWQVEMPAHYGEIIGSKGADGDPIDVYIGPKPEGDKVFVVDQQNPETGKFDEHKVMLGFESQREAEAAYDAAFSDGKGPARRGAVSETTKAGLRHWLDNEDTTKPFAEPAKPSENIPISIPTEISKPDNAPKISEKVVDRAGPIGTENIDFDNSNIVAQESGAGKNRGKKGAGETTKFEPSYFQIKPSELADDKALGERLVSGARSSDKQRAYQDSRRLTAVQDNETGKVFLLGTFREKQDGTVKLADPAKVGQRAANTRLGELLAQKTAAGEQRYTPFASMRLNEVKRSFVQEFADRAVFDKEIGHEADQRMATMADHAQTMEEMHAAGLKERGINLPENHVDEHPETGEELETPSGESATPDLKSDEGFTTAHADALWNVFGGEEEGTLTRERFEELMASDLPKSRRAVDAIGVALRSEMEAGKLSPLDALEIVKNKLYESLQKGDSGGKGAFKESAVSSFGAEPVERPAGGGDATAAPQATAGQQSAEQQSQGKKGNPVVSNPTNLSFRKPEGVSEVTGRHDQLLDSIHKAALDGGLNIQRIGQDLSGMSGDFAKQTGASYDQASRTVAQVVGSVVGREDVVTALHEVAHDVFARLPEASKSRILAAIDSLGDRALGVDLSADSRIRSSNPDGLKPNGISEERLVEATALRLTDAGFRPEAARGFAQSFVRALKDLYLRAAMSVQRALFGDSFTNPDLARRYFENKVKSFLAGDFNERASYIDFVGGGKASEGKVASWHTNESPVFERVGENGSIEYQHVPDTSLEAASMNNLVFRRPEPPVVDDPHSRVVEIEKRAALFNHQDDLIKEASELPDVTALAAKAKGEFKDPKKLLLSLLNVTDPHEMKKGLESSLEQDKSPVQYDQDKKISDFKGKSNIADVTRDAYRNVQALVSKVASVKVSAKEAVEKLTGSRERLLDRYEKAKGEYAGWQSSTTEATRAMRQEGKRLFGAIAGESKKQGAIEQQLRAIDPKADIKKYAPAFQKLFTGDQLHGEKLFNVLDRLANDPTIDFSKPVDKIREALAKNPAYADFVQDTNESRALTATITAFAKTHAQVMANLELRRNANGQERAAIVSRLDELKTEKASFLTNLRDIARTAKLEDRVRRAYRESLMEVRSMNRRIERAQNKATVADAFAPILAREHAELAGKLDIGSEAVWHDGMRYNVPDSPTASTADILKSTKQIALDTSKDGVSNPDQVESDLRKMKAFLDEREAQFAAGNHDAKDNIYNGIKRQFEEIAANKNFKVNVAATSKWMAELSLSPVGARIRDAFGTPAARMIDQMVNRFTSEQFRMRPEAERIGRRNDQLEDVLLKTFPHKLADARNYLRENFLNPAKRLMQNQDDLEERYAGNSNGLKSAMYNRVMSMLLNNEATRPYVRGNEPAWREGMQNLLEFQHESNKYLLKQVQDAGLSVADPKLRALNPATGKTEAAVRQHIPQGTYTFSQTLSKGFRVMVNALRNSGWAGEDGEGLAGAEFKKIGDLYNSGEDGPAKVGELVNKYFTHEQHGDQVRNQFFRAIAEMDTESPFDAPALSDGVTKPPADIAKVLEAYDRAGANPVKFAEALWDLHGGQVVHGEDGQPDLQNKGTYVQSTMQKLAEIAQETHNILSKVEPSTTERTVGVRGMTANALIDARSIDHLPGQWFDYHTFDQRDTSKMVERIASQAAFGRAQERLGAAFDTVASEVKAAQLKLTEARTEAQRTNPEANPKAIDKLLTAKFGKAEYDRLQKFSQRAKFVQGSVNDISTYFRRDNAPDGTLQAMTRASHALGALMINQPSSAIALLTQLTDLSLRYGASGSTVGATLKSIGAAGREVAGSLAQAVGLQIFNGGEYHRLYNELGLGDPAAIKKWTDAFDRLQGEGAMAHGFRAINDLAGTGINRLGDKAQHTIFKPGQLFNTTAVAINKAITEGIWKLTSKQVMRGMEFYRDNLDKFNDPTFKLSTEALKLRGGEKDSFNRLNQSMERWGMNYDDMVRGAMQRGDKTMFTNQEAVRLYSMGLSEVALESNLSTMPASAYNNSVVRFALPLLGWSFRRMQQVSELRLNADGKNDLKAFSRGLAGLGIVATGGLATSALIDQYYEKLVGKQRNLRPLTGSQDVGDFGLSLLENLNRVGTIGMWGELANGLVNVGQGGDNRTLSVDQRVLAVSSLQSVQQAISAWINQGYNADYAHVVRPLAGAVGGGGLIQYMQLANNALGLDNAEARITARINAQNYLRVVGRQLGLDVRTSDGGTFTPTPITPFLTNMELAAYKNSPGDFRAAYLSAIDAAKKQGHDDPVAYVKSAFATRNPLRSVFTTPPTAGDYARLLSNMPGSGQQDVSQAVNLFNQYAESIGAKGFEGKVTKSAPLFPATSRSIPLGDIRQRATLALQ